jgi:glyoxylase-like metal-dependent hydrolase (beta-lactamase superfamily II)
MRTLAAAALAIGMGACGGATSPSSPPASPPKPVAAIDAGSKQSPLSHYETVRIADGVYAFLARDDDSGIVNANSLVVVGDDGVLVVDSGQFPSLTRRQIAELRRITPLPVRYVVTTHWHGDHHMGNVAYQEAFPGVVFVASAETRRLETTAWVKDLAKAREDPTKDLRTTEAMLAAVDKPGAKPISPASRRRLESAVADFRLYPAELMAATFVPATLTFDSRLSLWLGRREVQVMHLGRGNTAGDAVVYVPDAKVLATGDLLVAPTPFAFGSYIGEWAKTLERLAAIDATTILPGHGPVMHDFAYARLLQRALVTIDADVRAAVRAGKTLDQTRDAETQRQDLRAGFATPDDPFRWEAFPQAFVAPAVERAYQEAKGKIVDEADE